MKTKDYKLDLCRGPIALQILRFALPLTGTFILQLLFNAVDMVVVGRFASTQALASVGATFSLHNLTINLLIGTSIGANVLAARYFGARDNAKLEQTIHTSIAVGAFGGLVVMTLAMLVAKPVLMLMKTPEDILGGAWLYTMICFAGIPLIMTYNFGCAILRAVGDTRRPLYYLIISGVVNVLLNLFFVIVCKMAVAGVALATIISHGISAALIIRCLCQSNDVYKLTLKHVRVVPMILRDMLKIGIPAGLQSSAFSFSNMIIQSSINSFGSLAIAGSTAAVVFEGIVYNSIYAYHNTAISFTAQNMGARLYKRILKGLYYCGGFAVIVSLIMGWGCYLIGPQLLALMTDDPEVVKWGMIRLRILFTAYFICAVMDVLSGVLRGLGYSVLSAIASLSGACFFRIFWIFTAFQLWRSFECLMWSYPISWGLAAMLSGTFLYYAFKATLRQGGPPNLDWKFWKPGLPRGYRIVIPK